MNVFLILKRLIVQLFTLPKSVLVRIIGAIFVIVFGVTANVIHPLVLRAIINSMGCGAGHVFSPLMLLMASYGLIWTVSYAYANVAWFLCKYPIDFLAGHMCKETFVRILRLPFAYYSNQKLYKAIANLEKVFHAVPSIFNDIIIYVIPEIIELILTLIVFTYLYGMWYGLLICLLFVIFFWSMVFTIKKATRSDQEYRDQFDAITLQINDTLSNFETVKIFNAETYEEHRLRKALSDFGDICKKRSFLLDGMPVIQMLVCGIFITFFTVLSGYFVYLGFINAGDFVLINSYLLALSLPVTYIGYVFAEMYRSLSSLYGFFEFFDLVVAAEQNFSVAAFKNNSIEFKAVSYYHDNKEQIVDNISFSIEHGKSIAIIGVSGSGKSTCARLLLKLLEPTKGEITIGGENIKDISGYDIRSFIGFIPQEGTIFTGTLRDNLTYGCLNYQEEDLKFAIKLLAFEKTIESLDKGLDTVIDESEFSNGEKQCISFIRAILRRAKIFIFDEPTSALDTQTEKILSNAITTITKDHTSVIITHSLSLAQNCNKILVLSDGKVVEYGTHEELILHKGLYNDMWQQQCA